MPKNEMTEGVEIRKITTAYLDKILPIPENATQARREEIDAKRCLEKLQRGLDRMQITEIREFARRRGI